MSNRERRDIGPAIHAALLERLNKHRKRFPSIRSFAIHCGIDPSIPSRWKTGTTPSLVTYLLLFNELDQLDLDKAEEKTRAAAKAAEEARWAKAADRLTVTPGEEPDGFGA